MSNRHEETEQATKSFAISEGSMLAPGRTRLLLQGHLDAEAAPLLAKKLRLLLERGVLHLELDCTELQFISSTGIGTIVATVGEYRDAGGRIVVSRLSAGILEVFESLDLLDYVEVL